MSNLIITVGSVTTAVRVSKKLNSYGIINTSVIHTPSTINSGGCSYSVRCDYTALENVLALAKSKKIKYRKLYKEDNVLGERVYYDISW